ncbi:TetR family transcriptional regulator [Pseudoduganella eburnea]|uniref:TetR family transcriptional regulator n=1 Tax=Massilia eburnea TaxID=1776165 RepID=A0A6L6QFQ6_9BURK|nr:TetR/AcrR family transcriptional regulator [Massilia eburnea]MTW10914.1 TetR family transcriptional regulator [Massilia eburnea]
MSVEQLPEPIKAGRPKAAEAEARLNDLMDTAARLLLEKGYGKVSLEAIAKEARVAVRTIYVKFGGKAGLLKAILQRARAGAFDPAGMESLHRPVRDTLLEFGLRFHRMVSTPAATALYQIVVAEAHANPDLAEAFWDAGPRQTRELLARYFARPDIAAQLDTDAPPERLAIHLMNCLMGDQLHRFLFESRCGVATTPEEIERGVDLFLRGVLKR